MNECFGGMKFSVYIGSLLYFLSFNGPSVGCCNTTTNETVVELIADVNFTPHRRCCGCCCCALVISFIFVVWLVTGFSSVLIPFWLSIDKGSTNGGICVHVQTHRAYVGYCVGYISILMIFFKNFILSFNSTCIFKAPAPIFKYQGHQIYLFIF